MTIQRCKYCKGELIELREGKTGCINCQVVFEPEPGFIFNILYPEIKESFEATI